MIQSTVLVLSVLFIVGIVVILTTALLMAEALLHPPRMTDGKAVYILKRLSPGDLGLRFFELRIPVRDSARPAGPTIELAAWWIPAETPSQKCVVLLHGYADAKVGSIAWAPAWHSLGFNILAVDLRAHGESGGRHCTAGFFERHDINEMLDRVRSIYTMETQKLVLFGASMGAAVALATATLRDDLAAVVIDSAFADYRTALRKNFDRLGLPTGIAASLAIRFAEMISSANFAAVRPLKLLRSVPCPIMLIRGEADFAVTQQEAKALDVAMNDRENNRDKIWILPGVAHLRALQADPNLYIENVRRFLGE